MLAAEYVPLLRLTQDSSTDVNNVVVPATGWAVNDKTDEDSVQEEEAKSTARIPDVGADQEYQ